MIVIILLCGLSFAYGQTPTTTSNFNNFVVGLQGELSLENQRADVARAPIVARQRVFQRFCSVMNRV